MALGPLQPRPELLRQVRVLQDLHGARPDAGTGRELPGRLVKAPVEVEAREVPRAPRRGGLAHRAVLVVLRVADPGQRVAARSHDGRAGLGQQRGLVPGPHQDLVALPERGQRPGQVGALGGVAGGQDDAADARVVQAVGGYDLQDPPLLLPGAEPVGRGLLGLAGRAGPKKAALALWRSRGWTRLTTLRPGRSAAQKPSARSAAGLA